MMVAYVQWCHQYDPQYELVYFQFIYLASHPTNPKWIISYYIPGSKWDKYRYFTDNWGYNLLTK